MTVTKRCEGKGKKRKKEKMTTRAKKDDTYSTLQNRFHRQLSSATAPAATTTLTVNRQTNNPILNPVLLLSTQRPKTAMNAVLYDNHDGEANVRRVINLLDFFDGDRRHDSLYAYNDQFFDDNISSFSGSSSCDAISSTSCLQVSCPDGQPLWFLVLRFMKMKVLSMARSYNAKPAVLIAGPLLIGIMIGFYLGRIASTTTPPSKTSKTAAMSLTRSTTSEVSTPSLPEQLTTTSTVLHHKMLLRIRQIHGRAVDLVSSIIYWFSCFIVLFSTAQSQRQQQSEETQEALSGIQSRSSSSSSSTNPTDSTASSSRLEDEKELPQHGSEKFVDDDELLHVREDRVRSNLKSRAGTDRESGVPVTDVPRHIGVIMDGNRRYGQAKYGSASRGHWEGSSKLVEFAKWCVAERVKVLTVFAFSTENWRRDPAEVAALMEIFVTYCDELRREALERNIKIVALSTNRESIPLHVQDGVRRMVEDTKHCNGMIMNICLSYGSRSEITAASRSLAIDAVEKKLDPRTIDESVFGQRLLTFDCGDPDILIRTSGEVRISNFLLWQLAYTELFFLDKPWPAIEKEDLLEVIRSFAGGRSRRFGK